MGHGLGLFEAVAVIAILGPLKSTRWRGADVSCSTCSQRFDSISNCTPSTESTLDHACALKPGLELCVQSAEMLMAKRTQRQSNDTAK